MEMPTSAALPLARSGEPRTSTALLLESIALRHQIAVLERSRTCRPCFLASFCPPLQFSHPSRNSRGAFREANSMPMPMSVSYFNRRAPRLVSSPPRACASDRTFLVRLSYARPASNAQDGAFSGERRKIRGPVTVTLGLTTLTHCPRASPACCTNILLSFIFLERETQNRPSYLQIRHRWSPHSQPLANPARRNPVTT
jgi:hypothetical protein